MADRRIGAVTVLGGERDGRYPHGNSLLVEGSDSRLLIDPSLSLVDRADRPEIDRIDRILLSHCHEDHYAGMHLYPGIPVAVHEADRVGLASIEDMMRIYGMPPQIAAPFEQAVLEQFHYEPRPTATSFAEGDVFDLGGGVRVTAVHLPGHTRGHCALAIEPEGVLYLGDIDLSSFGPYYGDAWSDLADFEDSLERVRELPAKHWATFHHIGVLDTRREFDERLKRFTAVIGQREARLVEYLDTPRTMAEIVEHRFVYRPGDAVPFADAVEERSMRQHLDRLVAAGRVVETDSDTWKTRNPQ